MAIIQSGQDTNLAQIEASNSIRTTIYPNYSSVGAYQHSAVSGSIAAATAANGILYTFKNAGTNLIILRRLSIGLQTTTAYTQGGIRFSSYFVRTSFTQGTTNATLVTLTGNNGKKRTSMTTTTAVAYICTTAGITGDTATGEDTVPFSTTVLNLPASITTSPSAGLVDMNLQIDTEYPLVFAANEGFRIKNDTAFAATGVSNLIVNVEYGEYVSYP